MAWLGLDRVFLGYSLDELQKESNQLDARKDQLDREDLDRGFWTPQIYEQAEANDQAPTSAYNQDVKGSVNQAFGEGWTEGRQNVSSGIKGFLNGVLRVVVEPLRAILGGIPWWLWIAAIAGVFLYFGGWKLVRKQLAKIA
jgi:hypothetical protein